MDRRSISRHVERRETGHFSIEQRVLIVDELFLLAVVGVSSATGADIMYTVFIEVLKRMVIARERDDVFSLRCIFLK